MCHNIKLLNPSCPGQLSPTDRKMAAAIYRMLLQGYSVEDIKAEIRLDAQGFLVPSPIILNETIAQFQSI